MDILDDMRVSKYQQKLLKVNYSFKIISYSFKGCNNVRDCP